MQRSPDALVRDETSCSLPGWSLPRLLAMVGARFARNRVIERVATTFHFDASPDDVWKAILFYEDVPRRPGFWLRAFLLEPRRTEGDKSRVGEIVRCVYDGGHIDKRMTRLSPGRCMEFDVAEQSLGMEACITTGAGSYAIEPESSGCQVTLTTHYAGHLRPRWLIRPFERWICRKVHLHVLEGMKALLARPQASRRLTASSQT